MNVDLRVLVHRLNPTTRAAIERAAGRCLSRTHYEIEIAHVLLALFDDSDDNTDCELILRYYRFDRSRLVHALEAALQRLRAGNERTPSFSPDLIRLLVDAWIVCSLQFDEAEIRSGYFLLAAIRDRQAVQQISGDLLRINPDDLRRDYGSIVATSAESKAAWTGQAGETRRGGPRVFICYRREDTAAFADALQDRLIAAIDSVQVFRDSDSLLPGMRFTAKIEEALTACDVVLVLIGKKWLTAAQPQGGRRIDAEQDWVRVEIATALASNKHVVPCVVGGASMPSARDLPDDIALLTSHNAIHLSQGTLRRDSEPLVALIQRFRNQEPPLA
jgi:hypothetical protein